MKYVLLKKEQPLFGVCHCIIFGPFELNCSVGVDIGVGVGVVHF